MISIDEHTVLPFNPAKEMCRFGILGFKVPLSKLLTTTKKYNKEAL